MEFCWKQILVSCITYCMYSVSSHINRRFLYHSEIYIHYFSRQLNFYIFFQNLLLYEGVWQLCQTAPMRQYSQECYELNQVVSIFCLSKWIWVLEEFEVAHWKRHWLTDSSSGFQSSITSHVLHGLHEGTMYHNSIFSKQGNVSYWAKIYIIYVL